MTVSVNDTTGYDLSGINLFPHQPDPVDQGAPGQPPLSDFLEDPFVKSKRAYRSRKAFPAKPAEGGLLGKMRDLNVGGVDLAGGRYKPKSRKLHVFTSLDVTVNFGGNNQGIFGDATVMNSPWEGYFARNYGRTVVNAATVAEQAPLRSGQAVLRRGHAGGDLSDSQAGGGQLRERPQGRGLSPEGRRRRAPARARSGRR